MPFKVPPDRRSVILDHAPQRHRNELAPAKLRESGVGLDHAQERHVGDAGVPNRADKHASKRRSRLRSLQESTVHTAVVDELPKAILRLNRAPRRALTK